ncbi:unnamed protein product [Symbiodinium sp. KB8]|nr:unnamed protein product [Symbiodinium sp. KB8]
MASSGASLAIRSSLRLELPISILHCGTPGAKRAKLQVADLRTFGSSSPLHSFGYVGSPASAAGLSRLGLLPLVLDLSKLDVLLAMRSLLRPGLLFLPLQCGSAGSMLPALDFGILDTPLLVQSMVALGAVTPVSDSLNLGPLLSLKSLARCGLALFVLDFAQLGPLPSMRSPAQLDATTAVHALVALGSASSVSDPLHLESPLFLRSLAQLDSIVPVLKSARTDSSLLLRSPACIGLFMSAADSATLASFLLVRGLARLELATLALDCSFLDAPLPLRRLACLGPAFSVFSHENWTAVACCGPCWVGGSLATVRAFGCFGTLAPIPDIARCGFSLPAHGARRSALQAQPLKAVAIRVAGQVGFCTAWFAVLGMELSLAEAFIVRVANRIMDSTVKLLLTHCDAIMADLGKCQQNCPVSGSAAPVKSRVKQGPVPHAAGCSDAIDRLFSWFCNVRVGLSAFRDAFAVAVPFAPWSLHSCGFCVSIGCESLRAGLGRAWRFISSALPCKIGPVFHSVGFSKDGTDTFSAGIRQAWQLSIPGQSVPFRSSAQLEVFVLALGSFLLSAKGLAKSEPVSLTLDSAMPESSPFMRSRSRLGLQTLLLDFLHLDMPMPPRALSRPEVFLLALGVMRIEPPLLLLEAVHLESILSARSPAQVETFLSASAPGHLGSSLISRNSACAGFAVASSGHSRSGSSMLAVDLLHLGLSVSSQTLARMGTFMSSFSRARIGSLSSALDPACMDLPALLRSLSCLGACLSVSDLVVLGAPFLVQAPVRSDSALLVLDFVQVASTLPARSLCHAGTAAFAPDASYLDSLASLRSSSWLDFLVSVVSWAQPGFVLPLQSPSPIGPALLASDPLHPEASLLLRSTSCPGISLLTLSFQHSGFLLLLQAPRTDFAPPSTACASLGLLLFAPDLTTSGLSMALHSSGWLALLLPILDPSHSDSFLSSRRPSCSDSPSLLVRFARLELSMATLDSSWPGSIPTAQSGFRSEFAMMPPGAARLDLPLSVPDYACLDLSALMHSLAFPDVFPSVSGRARMELLLTALDPLHLEPLFLLKSSACVNSLTSVLDSLHPGMLPPLRSLSWSGPYTPVFGPTHDLEFIRFSVDSEDLALHHRLSVLLLQELFWWHAVLLGLTLQLPFQIRP